MHTMKPTGGEYDINQVDGINALMSTLETLNQADSHGERVEIVADLLLNGHKGVSGYLTFGNNKVSRNTGIFNMNSATDCPNADSTESDQSDTGVCQVPWNMCYAHKAESQYDRPLAKRRLQEYLWDNVDAFTFADAILRVKERKRSPFTYLRVSESGDFRHNSDIIKWDIISEKLQGEIDVYTYSASHKLDWSFADNFTVNQSNGLADYGDRQFTAVEKAADVPADGILCPFDAGTHNNMENDARPKCGECTHCIKPAGEQSKDVFITIH